MQTKIGLFNKQPLNKSSMEKHIFLKKLNGKHNLPSVTPKIMKIYH